MLVSLVKMFIKQNQIQRRTAHARLVRLTESIQCVSSLAYKFENKRHVVFDLSCIIKIFLGVKRVKQMKIRRSLIEFTCVLNDL